MSHHAIPITMPTMFEPLLEADPSFRPTWDEFLEYWRDETDPPIYLALNGLALHLIRQLSTGELTGFPAVFAIVELWHAEGDHDVRNAATVGLLEALQISSYYEPYLLRRKLFGVPFGSPRGPAPDDFRPWLGAETSRWWDKVEAFWRDGTLLTDD